MNDPMRSKARRARLAGLFAAMALAALLASCRWPWEPDPAKSALVLSGTVDARQVDLSFQAPGRIARLLSDEGQAVKRGAVVAELDSSDLQLGVDRARAQAQSAAQALAALKAGARPQELRVAQAAVAQAQADEHFADQQVGRTQELVNQHFVSPDQMDRVRNTADGAAARLDQATQTLALLRAGARPEDLERAAAEVDAARAAQRAAERMLAYAQLASPVGGVVSVRLAEAGQVVAAGQPVLRVAELPRPWVRAYLAQTDLPRVRLGDAVEVRVDGLPGRVFRGRLAFVSPQAEFTPKTVETRALRVDLVYRVKVDLEDPDGLLKIGMPADVTFTPAPPLP
jgi:HlyD family secretion protein